MQMLNISNSVKLYNMLQHEIYHMLHFERTKSNIKTSSVSFETVWSCCVIHVVALGLFLSKFWIRTKPKWSCDYSEIYVSMDQQYTGK